MKPLKQRVTTVTLTPPGEPIFSERGYTVSIDDEAAGEFIVVRVGRVGDAARFLGDAVSS